MKKEGIDSNKVLDTYIKLYNDCLEGHEKDMTIGLHLCRGNFKGGMHFSEGGYDAIAVKLFNEINCDTYYLECMSLCIPRAQSFPALWGMEADNRRYPSCRKLRTLGLLAKEQVRRPRSHQLQTSRPRRPETNRWTR